MRAEAASFGNSGAGQSIAGPVGPRTFFSFEESSPTAWHATGEAQTPGAYRENVPTTVCNCLTNAAQQQRLTGTGQVARDS